jgi:hypothetical protein
MAGAAFSPIYEAGKHGIRIIGDTVAWTGQAVAIQVLATAVFSVLTGPTLQGIAIGAVVLPVGAIVFGNITAVTLASGSVALYLGQETHKTA